MQKPTHPSAITLIELLIVIALLAIIAAVAFVALDPLKRFQDTRDARRLSDITAIATAIKVAQVDNGGKYTYPLNDNVTNNMVYMLSNATTTNGCADYNGSCLTDVDNDTYCVNLSHLVTAGYLAEVPISPTGSSTWSGDYTGYTFKKVGNNIEIRACEAESGSGELVVKR
jgi:prepilin-type N-terminal cleavage/methylation domain-containing protein